MRKLLDISEDTYRDLEAEAGRQGQTPSEYVEAMLKDRLGNAGDAPKPEDPFTALAPFGVPQIQVSDPEALEKFFEENAHRCRKQNVSPFPVFSSGGHLVDISNRDELYKAMDGF
jgi:hypothetical protein